MPDVALKVYKFPFLETDERGITSYMWSMDRTYPIKTKPGDAVKVVGGNLYKLSVTIGNASEDIDFVIEDWIPNTLSVGDIFGEPVK